MLSWSRVLSVVSTSYRKEEKKELKGERFEFEFWLLLYAHRHQSILGAAGHIIMTPA
jgi:hypothetical protein